jgi:hypothetical protein
MKALIFILLLTVSLLTAHLSYAGSETDDFERTDDADLGVNWTPYDDGSGGGVQPCALASGGAISTLGLGIRCYEGYSHFIPAVVGGVSNQYAEITLALTHIFDFAREFGLLLRMTDPATSLSGYVCMARPTGTLSRIRRLDAGGSTTLAGGVDVDWLNNDVVRCTATADGFVMTQNGVTVMTATDATYATGRTGIEILDDNIINLTTFTVGDVSAGATVVRHRPIVMQ